MSQLEGSEGHPPGSEGQPERTEVQPASQRVLWASQMGLRATQQDLRASQRGKYIWTYRISSHLTGLNILLGLLPKKGQSQI